MSIELQIRSAVLANITARAVQQRLRTTCFAAVGTFYIDHADVAASPIEIHASEAAVRLRVPLDVFVVRREDVLAAPNAVPVGATASAGVVVVVLEMAVAGAVLSLRCVDAELGALGVVLGAAAAAAKTVVVNAVGSPAASNLGAALKQLGMPTPGSSRIDLVDDVVAVRFEPTGAALSHLFGGQDWGMFLDGAAVERLALSKVPTDTLGSRITSMSVTPHWRPVGTLPHVDLDYAGKAQVPDPFAGDLDGVMACDFALTPTITKSLRTTVLWSLHINLGDLVPGFVDNIVEDAIADAFDPTKFGGTSIGDHAFTLDSPLPQVAFGGARCGYGAALASAAGMTIGGPVQLPLDPGKATLVPSVHAFGLPVRLTFCRQLATSGSGVPSKTVSLAEVSTTGTVWLADLGKFCDLEILAPGDWIEPYVRRPGDSPEIRIVVPSAVALGITAPVRLIVRTARGVRLIDLGTPPKVVVDIEGNVTNALTWHINDCLHIDVQHGLAWAQGGGLLDQAVVNPPLEHPDWTTYLGRHLGLDVQLLTLSELEPGELIQFRSADHAVDVTADRHGRALVPVFLPIVAPTASQPVRASLVRVNRRSIAGRFKVQSAMFVEQASLPVGRQARLAAMGGAAVVTAEFERHVDTHQIGRLGAPILLQRLQRQPAPSPEFVGEEVRSACHPSLAKGLGLPGVAAVVAVPGFADAPIALATMKDGSTLVLDLGADGAGRVAGTLVGPIGPLSVAADWGLNAGPERAAIFRLLRA